MKIELNIPDASANELVNGAAVATGWTAGSGVTKGAWVKEKVCVWLKEMAKRGLVKTQQTAIVAQVDAVTIT